MCELDIHDSHNRHANDSSYKYDNGKLHKLHWLHPGQDSRCPALKAKVAELMAEDKATAEEKGNIWFCTKSE